MKRWLAAVAILAFILQFLIAWAMPSIVMAVLWYKGAADAGLNTMKTRPVPNADTRFVVRPSPDLAYSVCFFDLSGGALDFSSEVPEPYWSLQFYGENTDNFAGFSNRGDKPVEGDRRFRMTLIGPGQDSGDYSGRVVQAPSERGVALIRESVIGASGEELYERQKGHRCGV